MPLGPLKNPAFIARFDSYFAHPGSQQLALSEGEKSDACVNIRAALNALAIREVRRGDKFLFDASLSDAVKRFQRKVGHKTVDGAVGPGTRRQLVAALFSKLTVPELIQLAKTQFIRTPVAFLTYAHKDAPRVDKLDQWLRDHNINVLRDVRDFKGGDQLPEAITNAALVADKVIAVYSKASKKRDWPSWERSWLCELRTNSSNLSWPTFSLITFR